MKKTVRRLLALALCTCLSAAPALALTPQELGTILKNEYAGEVPAQVWQQDTVEGMLAALGDPFTHYYTAQEFAAFQERAAGETGSAQNSYTVEHGMGVVRLEHFGEPQALRDWMSANSGLRHWVVDLRGNRGGELKNAVVAMSAFAGKGELVFLRDKDGKLYSAKSDQSALTMDPAVVLLGRTTASAAELFAATLRDRQMALLVGSRTYGKGVAQSVISADHPLYSAAFSDGSALLLTTDLALSDGLLSHNIMGVLPHLMVDEALAPDVAALLTTQAPTGGDNSGWLRLVLARWRWYVDPAAAQARPEALQALLEALPPQTQAQLGTGGDRWRSVGVQEAAGALGVSGYTPRAFPDVSGSAYADAINALKTYDILQGDEAGLFHPSAPLTRASLCALLAQAMGYPKSAADPAFADTPAEAWYTPYVTTLSAMGIVNGYDDGLFHPDDPIPHQQFMTILARVVSTVSHASRAALQTGPSQAELDSGDYDAYDPWAVPGAWLLDGAWHDSARDIDPQGVTLREEAAFDLWSALSTMGLILS